MSNADASRAVSGALAQRNLNLGALRNAKVPALFDEIRGPPPVPRRRAEGRHEDAFSAIIAAIHAFVKDFKNQ